MNKNNYHSISVPGTDTAWLAATPFPPHSHYMRKTKMSCITWHIQQNMWTITRHSGLTLLSFTISISYETTQQNRK